MAVGRISGPLLSQNLFRDDVPLGFYNTSSSESPVLYLDVTNGFVGIKNAAPNYQLDVGGTINANVLRVPYTGTGTGIATIGNFSISSSTISTVVGSFTVKTSAGDNFTIDNSPTRITSPTQSTGTTTGALVVDGGVGIGKNLYVGGITNITAGVPSTTNTNGSLVVQGGVGITGDLNVGGVIFGSAFSATISVTSERSESINIHEINSGLRYPIISSTTTGFNAVDANRNFVFNVDIGNFSSPLISVTSSTASTSANTGALTVVGGAGIGGRLYVADRTILSSTASSTSTTTGALTVTGGVGIGGNLNVGGNIHATGNISADGNIQLGNNTATDTLVVDAVIDSDLIPKVNDQYNLGSTASVWANAYLDKIYGKILGSQTGPVTINPANDVLEINADIKVNGTKPYGTAPVVTNILYVTMDGLDTNDGRAMDASRACRTIGAALRSPYYGPGTSIKVSPGHYFEDNPLVLQPYTSIIGSDLRTTSIEPINKTQDLFHLQSGCYLAQMLFANGRSGLLPGNYAPGYNRGAYATAFPPQVGGTKIDVFHSPYVQNCTNQSGPWLVDGTYFIPNQTIQIPLAVGTGTWIANTTTIVVTVSTGTITAGMSINPGQQNPGFFNARTLLLANKQFIQEQVIGYVNSVYPTFVYSQAKCYRDIGIILENIVYDATFGGNEKTLESGLSYYDGVTSVIAGQEVQTVAAINYINTLSQYIIINSVAPVLVSGRAQIINTALTGGAIAGSSILANINTITNIINYGTAVAPAVYKSSGPDNSFVSAEILLQANRTFIQTDTISWISNNHPSFVYNTSTCYRDVGLIVDAVSQDILLGGNTKTIDAGLSYWKGGYPQILGQETTTTLAISHARNISLQIIANETVTSQVGNNVTQIKNTYFSNGTAAAGAVTRNFGIINTIIIDGPALAPPVYQGGGLFAITGISVDDTKIAPTVSSISTISENTYSITLSTATVGFGTNSTLYFGNTAVFPLPDSSVPDQWAQRRIDPIGAMGGSLVDGGVVSARSPIASMVYDAYTQVNQGGRGIHIINNGYAQLVSVFTIFCSIAVQVDSGGIASITNSNSNFGDKCLIAKGYGNRNFSGTIYNPAFPSFITNGEYYPNGYWPQNGQTLIFVPDTANRPHIAQIMEVEPPVGYINSYGYPGFVTAAFNTGTLTTGSITISGIATVDISIGHTIHVRDQFGRTADGNGIPYLTTGTIVTDVNYQEITLNKAINQGGGDTTNANYFTLYSCGNAYYTVLSSSIYDNPVAVGSSLIPGQTAAEISSLDFINTLTSYVVTNSIPPVVYSTAPQTILNINGSGAIPFITNRIGIIKTIVSSGVNAAPTIFTIGTIASNAGNAISLIKANIEFITQETISYVDFLYPVLSYDKIKCARDVRLILQQLIYDLETGGNYNSVYSGLSYWSRAGTYHLVSLGENIRDPGLMPDGCTVNFYQRSYISASGYTFEYVGAGTNYGSLPQVGVADPVQGKEVIQLDSGKVFYTSTDQGGDFRIGPELVISQATGVLSGRTFTKSLFANLTPFILALESGGA